jgi:hypothetical protein
MLFGRSTASLLWLIQTGLGMAVLLGWVRLTADQVAGILAFAGAFFAYLTNQTTTPNPVMREIADEAVKTVQAKNAELDLKYAAARGGAPPEEGSHA